MALTRRQKEVLDFIADFVHQNGYSPSYEEIAAGLRLASLATVHKHITALDAKHYLKRSYNQSRSLEVSPKYVQEQKRFEVVPEIPLMGRIAAGAPVEAIESQASIEFSDFAGNPNVFALEVSGDSMIEDHICDGDYVLVEKTAEARDGDIVVALVRGADATLKRFFHEPNGMARLQPANSVMEPIYVPLAELQIQGRLMAVLRKYR
jgi:repressor LexA